MLGLHRYVNFISDDLFTWVTNLAAIARALQHAMSGTPDAERLLLDFDFIAIVSIEDQVVKGSSCGGTTTTSSTSPSLT
jgi:hypothetical protein